ncbi:MAG TPA: lipid-A-disaccharide synthase [Candidatus Wallbacteria bacterium]|nr:lipid-A-disaccharide synthase [Candidatus Wallbacteria bacterium]
MKKDKKIMIIAGEISGDLYGHPLVLELMKSGRRFEICGIGGPRMKSAGMKTFYDSSSWGTIGMIEAIKKLPYLYWAYYDISEKLKRIMPDVLVLIDYPGFNMRLCRRAKQLGIPTLYYFPPSKWSYNHEDVCDAARTITKVAAPFEHTYDIYKKAGANVEFVGNPLLEIVKTRNSRAEILKKLKVAEGEKIISLLPGSRSMEVRYMLPVLAETAAHLGSKLKDARFIMPVSSSTISRGTGITLEYINDIINSRGAKISVETDMTYDILSVSDFSIITSGTATLEAACLLTPMVIVYKVSLLTEMYARIMTSLPKYFGLPNLILNKAVVPEFIQKNVTPDIISNSVIELLNSSEKLADMKNELKSVVKNLGEAGATKKVSEMILKMVE